jgi:DnaJ-class molecular chaperone
MSAQADYWREAVMYAFEGIDRFDLVKDLTKEQLDDIGEALATSAEHQSMAFGWDVASANRHAEIQRTEDNLRKEIRRERDKITCRQCNGHGWATTQGPYHYSTSQCFKCHGEGRHDP